MTISELSIKRPVFAWMLMAGLIIFGAVSFLRMGVSQLPDVDFPVISVSLSLEGAAPEVMETDVVDIVEDAVMSIEGVRTVTSSSKNGSASVTIEFELNRNIDNALQDVQGKLSQVARRLPKEIDPPVISKTNPEDQPIIWVTLQSSSIPLKDLMAYVNDNLKNQFATVAGVGDITLGGYVDPNLRVWVDNDKLKQYSLSVTDVINAVQREHNELPAGQVTLGSKQFNVRTLGETKTIEEFNNIVINQRGGQPNYKPIRIHEVATIEDGLADIKRLSRGNGIPAIGLGIRKQRGSNAVQVAHGVKAKMNELQKIIPKGTELAINFDSTKFIEDSVGELNFTLLLSALLTAVVCWLFLGSWTSTLNVLLAIPTSVVGTFIILYFAGFTLNTFTLLALSLSIGIVVDDAIMVLENIIRHREHGLGREEAALVGSKEITFAAMAATISIVAIFLPVAFMQGVIGKFFFQFGVTMTAAVLLSLLEALTLTPMRCAQFVEVTERTTKFGKAIEAAIHNTTRFYEKTLRKALEHRWKVLICSLVLFGISIFSFKFLNKEFVPPEDQSRFMIRLQTPVGSSLEFTDEKFKKAEAFLAKRPEVVRFFGSVGGFGGDVNTGIIFVSMKDKGKRGIDPDLHHEITQFELMDMCRKFMNKIGDTKAVVQDLSNRAFSASRGFPIEFTVQGPEWEELAKYSQEIMKRLEATGLAVDLDSDYKVGMPEVHIIPNRDKAPEHGVSVGSIGETIDALIAGETIGKYERGGHRYDIRLKLKEDNKSQIDKINDLYVRNNRGEMIKLSSVVSLEKRPTLQSISRRNRERAISVFGNLTKGASQEKVLEKIQEISKEVLPGQYHIVISGSAQSFKESLQSLFMALIMGLVVAYMVLASQFNSFIDPVTVLMALPFSVSGAFLGLLVTHQSINIYSMIGLILLMGIVKKNSILLVDFTNQMRAEGLNIKDALLKACPIRLRPILMTSIATVAGAIPPALGIGPGAESRVPMAVGVIGGVIFSTTLTLYVVPCVYSLFGKFKHDKVKAP